MDYKDYENKDTSQNFIMVGEAYDTPVDEQPSPPPQEEPVYYDPSQFQQKQKKKKK